MFQGKGVNIILLAVIGILVSVLLHTCQRESKDNSDSAEIAMYKHKVMYYENRAGKMIAYNNAIETNHKTALRQIDSLKGYLKEMEIRKPRVIIKVVTNTVIDSVPVPFEVPLPCDEFTRNINIDSTYYKMDFKLTREQFTINSIRIPNHQEIVIGNKKNGLFKRDSLSVIVNNSNPYVQTNSIGALTIQPKVKWHDRWYTKAGGALLMFIVGRATK